MRKLDHLAEAGWQECKKFDPLLNSKRMLRVEIVPENSSRTAVLYTLTPSEDLKQVVKKACLHTEWAWPEITGHDVWFRYDFRRRDVLFNDAFKSATVADRESAT
jgi:hypothetical protein